MRSAKARQLVRLRRLARLQQKAATAGDEFLAEDDETELMLSVPPSFEAMIRQREKMFEMMQAAGDSSAPLKIEAGDGGSTPAQGAEAAEAEAEILKEDWSDDEDDGGEDDIVILEGERGDNNEVGAGAGGPAPAASSRPPMGSRTLAAVEQMPEPEAAFPGAAIRDGMLIPHHLVEQTARRLRLRQLLQSAAEAGVLPSNPSDGDRGRNIAGIGIGGAWGGPVLHSDDNGGNGDEGEGDVLPRMLGLVPEGNVELASTYAWEDDIIWGDEEPEEEQARRKPLPPQPLPPQPPKAADEAVVVGLQKPVPLSLPAPARRPLGLHPQALRLEGIPSGHAPPPPPPPIASTPRGRPSGPSGIKPPSTMVVLSTVALASAGQQQQQQQQGAGVADAGASISDIGLSALCRGSSAALTAKLRLQPGLASDDWILEVEGSSGSKWDGGRPSSSRHLPWLQQRGGGSGGSGGTRPSSALSLCAPGTTPLLLDLNDPDMVFTSNQALALR